MWTGQWGLQVKPRTAYHVGLKFALKIPFYKYFIPQKTIELKATILTFLGTQINRPKVALLLLLS